MSTKAKLPSRAFYFSVLILIVSLALCLPVVSADNIEFNFRIVPPSTEKNQKANQWVVELRALGKIVRSASATEWKTIRFRNLKPGIYRVCVTGNFNRMSCESIDLYPPGDQKPYKVSKQLTAPGSILNRNNLYSVDSRDLVVPEEARVEMIRAEMSMLRNQDSEAIRHLQTAIHIYPEYADALNCLGIYYKQNGEMGKALELFTKVTQIAPQFYGGWVNLSSVLLTLSKFPEALEKSRRAYELCPQDPIVLSYYARSLYYVHDFELARRYFMELRGLDPANVCYPQLFLAQIALRNGNIAEGQFYVAEFLKMHPNAPEAMPYRRWLESLTALAQATPPRP